MNSAAEIQFDVLVVGAGAAGQMAAIRAAQNGVNTVIFEQMPKPGLKILASGGGRCNMTNLVSREEFMTAFGRRGRFAGPALDLLSPEKLRGFFESLGVATVVEGQRVYPATHRSGDVQKALRSRCDELGVRLCTGQPVKKLWIESGKLLGVEIENSEKVSARAVVLACGGLSYCELGATGRGYTLARQAGHTLVEPVPAGVALVTGEPWAADAAGVVIPNARVRIALPKQSKSGIRGDVLFTHRGVSGPAVLDISGEVSRLLTKNADVPLEIQIVDGMDFAHWEQRFDNWRQNQGSTAAAKLVCKSIPASIARLLCNLNTIDPQTPLANIRKPQLRGLAKMLAGLKLNIISTEGFSAAFVTSGGIALKGVNPKTMQSKIMTRLYFAGEMLDLDGPCGGYNLQWAFSSGFLAGYHASRDVLNTE